MSYELLRYLHKIDEAFGYGHKSAAVQMLTWEFREVLAWSNQSGYVLSWSYERYGHMGTEL